RGPERAAGRQLHRPRPALSRRLPPRDRGVPALPLGRRVDGEGTVRPRLPGGAGRRAREGGRPPRSGRHSGKPRRAEVLPVLGLQIGFPAMTVFGVHAGLQNTTMADLVDLWRLAERLGFGWVSVWDHFYAADASG